MATIRPDQLPGAVEVNPASAIPVDDGAKVEKATPLQLVDSATPLATQSDAKTGTDNTKRVTPLRVKQAIDALGVSAENLASTDTGKGVDFLGKVVSPDIPYPVVLRTILTDMQVSRMLSGAGDGDTTPAAVTAETAKFQAVADQGRSFSVPQPNTTFAVNTINLASGQTIQGAGQYSYPLTVYGGPFQFTGNGVDPVFVCGDGTGGNRQHTLLDLSVTNDGGDCVQVLTSPNFLMERCRIRGVNARGIYLNYSWRTTLRSNWIGGAIAAIEAKDNINGLAIENNTVTGGTAGKAMDIGMSQSVRIVTNIIEASRDGIWLGSSNEAGNGNCNGILVASNYFEQVGTPLVLGKVFSIFGLKCHANFLSNTSAANLTYRQAMIQFGRLVGSSITDNVLYPVNKTLFPAADDEDLFWIWLESASGGFDDATILRNKTAGTGAAANVYQFKGAFAANVSVKSAVGGACNFGFMGDGDPTGTDGPNEYVSPPIDPTVTATYRWLYDDRMSMGGVIKSAELIDYDGGTLTNVQLSIGREASLTENFSTVDMGALTFTNGRSPLTLSTKILLDGSNRTFRILGDAAATGTFRLRIRFRAN